MKISKSEIIAILSQFNPWWRGEGIPDLPSWHRAAFDELFTWVAHPPAPRAVLLSGARQVGKTTLLLQAIDRLLKEGARPANILYATFDHPILKLAGIDAVLDAWREREPRVEGVEYLFLDEAQFIRDWGTWVKHQVDFSKSRRIIFTGSAIPLADGERESGVGRWVTLRMTTLSFYEYLQIRRFPTPSLPKLSSLKSLYEWNESDFLRVSEMTASFTGHFHEYLIRGGFPQTALVDSITQSQRLLREDIIDKALKRDMTVLFGIRRVLELEQCFIYLCMHDGGILDISELCSNLSVTKPTAQHFIDLLESTHLIYRLSPYGHGKEILRARYKIYLADAAIAPAVLLKGKTILEDPAALGVATETAVFKHLFAHGKAQSIRFSYWRGSKDKEVDLIYESEGQLIPFEIKYRSQASDLRQLKGLMEFCEKKSVSEGYVVTKSLRDFGPLKQPTQARIMQIPAALLCYWLGESELNQQPIF